MNNQEIAQELRQNIEIVRSFNKWRRGAGEGSFNVISKNLGVAIDVVCGAAELTLEDIAEDLS